MTEERGRPSTGATEVSTPLRLSRALLQLADDEAGRVGVRRAEWLRRAVRHYAQSGSPVVHPYVDED